jgi:anti-sigma B factor antagonist
LTYHVGGVASEGQRMEMQVSEIGGNVTCVHLTGRLDAPGVDLIGARFSAAVAAMGRDAIVDLAGVSFLASMGMRLLISTARALHGKGAKLVLFGAQPLVQSVFDQAAFDQIVAIVADEGAALRQLDAG